MPSKTATRMETAMHATRYTQRYSFVELEQAIRERLAIPSWAERVMIVAESTHWDPDWVLTSGEYYKYMVRRALERAVDELQADERRIFDIECIFFLRKYFERSPHRQEAVRLLVNAGRIRLTGSGITTPDTLLPTEEALVRDLLTGQNWLRDNGMLAEPRTLYLPDSFGHTPCLPSLARSCGIDAVAFTRIDGMHFIGLEYTPKSHYPRLHSSAEELLDARALDFIWKDSNGSEVLAHWNAFNYGHGDMIATHGISRALGMYQGVPDRSDRNVARKIERYAGQLDRYSPTPYLLLTLGLDFTIPLKGLVALLDRYNQLHARQSGVYVVNAGLDDYLDLVRCHSHSLPTISLDPNPYFMGFYGSRLPLKRMHRRITDYLITSETVAAISGNVPLAARIADDNALAWEIAAVSNHHDFITGTGSDRVYGREQRPWLLHAFATARRSLAIAAGTLIGTAAGAAVGTLAGTASASDTSEYAHTPELSGSATISSTTPRAASTQTSVPQPSWQRTGDVLSVETSRLRIQFDLSRGGMITTCVSLPDEIPLLGKCGELVSLKDRGGMWRLGNEFAGGDLSEVADTSTVPTNVIVRPYRNGIEVTMNADLEGRPTRTVYWIHASDPFLAVHCEVHPRWHRSVVYHFAMPYPLHHARNPLRIDSRPIPRTPFMSGPRYSDTSPDDASGTRLIMTQPGGVVVRPIERHFRPTFWPLNGWAYIQRPDRSSQSLAIASLCSTGISVSNTGNVLVMAGRNPGKERALGLVPFLGFPVAYREKERCVLDCAVLFQPASDRSSTVLPAATRAGSRALDLLQAHADPTLSSLRDAVSEMVVIEPSTFKVIAAKPAADGNGVIVRLGDTASSSSSSSDHAATGAAQDVNDKTQGTITLILSAISPGRAHLCDSMERYIAELPVAGNSVSIDRKLLNGSTATVRIIANTL